MRVIDLVKVMCVKGISKVLRLGDPRRDEIMSP